MPPHLNYGRRLSEPWRSKTADTLPPRPDHRRDVRCTRVDRREIKRRHDARRPRGSGECDTDHAGDEEGQDGPDRFKEDLLTIDMQPDGVPADHQAADDAPPRGRQAPRKEEPGRSIQGSPDTVSRWTPEGSGKQPAVEPGPQEPRKAGDGLAFESASLITGRSGKRREERTAHHRRPCRAPGP